MTPFTAGNIAVAQREIARCIEEIKRACSSAQADAWKHVALAHTHAIQVQARLNDAVELEEQAERMAG